jgi:choline kinase
MKAIILAAGLGRRLAPLTDGLPKCLLRLGGRSLLERMLDAVEAAGVSQALVVVGHCQEQIRDRIGSRFRTVRIRYAENRDYMKGSLLSLWHAREALDGDCLVMDADVLFAPPLLKRLVDAPRPSALLLDPNFTDTGEEVKLYARGPRVLALGKKVSPPAHDLVGEGVGFLKCGAIHAPALRECLEEVRREAGDGTEYEEALDRLLRRVRVGWVDVAGLPWTEIDFPEDLSRAEREVVPKIEGQLA